MNEISWLPLKNFPSITTSSHFENSTAFVPEISRVSSPSWYKKSAYVTAHLESIPTASFRCEIYLNLQTNYSPQQTIIAGVRVVNVILSHPVGFPADPPVEGRWSVCGVVFPFCFSLLPCSNESMPSSCMWRHSRNMRYFIWSKFSLGKRSKSTTSCIRQQRLRRWPTDFYKTVLIKSVSPAGYNVHSKCMCPRLFQLNSNSVPFREVSCFA